MANSSILVGEIVGDICVDYDHGHRVFHIIQTNLADGGDVALDFTGVDVFASPFFNAAIGQLLHDFSSTELNRRVRFQNLPPQGQLVLKRSIANAKKYYSDPDYRQALRDVIDE